MTFEEIEIELSKTIGKSIKGIDILFDEDGMDVFFMEMLDDAEFYIKNSKQKNGDDYRIYSDSDFSHLRNAQVLSFELFEDFDNLDFDNTVIESIKFVTDKGEINLEFENEGVEDFGWALAAFLIYMNI